MCVGLTRAHVLFLPQTKWTLERLCSPLLFPFQHDTLCLHFLLSQTLFCNIWLKQITETKVYGYVKGLWSRKVSKLWSTLNMANELILVQKCVEWHEQHNCCEILHVKVFRGRCHSLWVTCFIDIFVEHLVLFSASLLLLDFWIFIRAGLRRNSCGLRIQRLNLPCFKSVEAQQGHRNVSFLQEEIE